LFSGAPGKTKSRTGGKGKKQGKRGSVEHVGEYEGEHDHSPGHTGRETIGGVSEEEHSTHYDKDGKPIKTTKSRVDGHGHGKGHGHGHAHRGSSGKLEDGTTSHSHSGTGMKDGRKHTKKSDGAGHDHHSGGKHGHRSGDKHKSHVGERADSSSEYGETGEAATQYDEEGRPLHKGVPEDGEDETYLYGKKFKFYYFTPFFKNFAQK